MKITNKNNKSFTLIELLVVLALVAILSVVVVMTLNPAELIKQARDSNRLSDLSTINTALNLFSADVTNGFMGTSSIVYVSIPSATSTCSNLGLPILPPGYTYNCVTAASTRNTDGTGWIPVNFQRISSNSPISQLPVDPQNTTSTKYYTYVTGGSWQLATQLESTKYQATAYSSGGADPSTYTVGNNLSLAPFVSGLVGWWKFDEMIGTTSTDSSGWRNDGTLFNSPTWSSGKINGALSFNNSNTYVLLSTSTQFFVKAKTLAFWANPTGVKTYNMIFACPSANYYMTFAGSGDMFTSYINGNASQIAVATASGIVTTGSWNYYSFVFDVSEPTVTIKAYKNGQVVGTQNRTDGYSSNIGAPFYLGAFTASNNVFNGLLDDIRFYNRALSSAEISALYNGLR